MSGVSDVHGLELIKGLRCQITREDSAFAG